MKHLKIGIAGAGGRMGKILVAEVARTNNCALSGASVHENTPCRGLDAGDVAGIGRIGILLQHNPVDLFENSDVVIDFTTPSASLEHCLLANEYKTALVIGTTGFNEKQADMLKYHGKSVPIVGSPNMSLGVNVLLAVTEQVARLLDDEYDIEIFELHHRHKVDAPSGTALALGRAAASGRKAAFNKQITTDRGGQRKAGTIGFSIARGGDVVGDHTVFFATDGERLELSHKASSRQIYARGAIKAAFWLHGRPAGLYSMRDVLGLK
jgi:4-hydroxy-tetrahydrodipicolinate reductase